MSTFSNCRKLIPKIAGAVALAVLLSSSAVAVSYSMNPPVLERLIQGVFRQTVRTRTYSTELTHGLPKFLRNFEGIIEKKGVAFRFTTDSNACRISPTPVRPGLPAIIFLGGSWTLGDFVDDEATFAYLTGESLNDIYTVYNCSERGTAGISLLPRLRALRAKNAFPRLRRIVVEWMPGELAFLKRAAAPQTDRSTPLLAIEQDGFLELQKFCSENGIGLTVLMLARGGEGWTKVRGHYGIMRAFFHKNGFDTLDVSDIPNVDRPSPFDPHPGPEWHRSVAGRILDHLKRVDRAAEPGPMH